MAMYSGDGKGRWWKTTWAKQCSHKMLGERKCQGVEGHEGVHWYYNETGWFHWTENEEEADLKDPYRAAAGHTPPGHSSWVDPRKKQRDCWMDHWTREEVTDEELIANLERGEPPHRNDTINRPLTEKALKTLPKKVQKVLAESVEAIVKKGKRKKASK